MHSELAFSHYRAFVAGLKPRVSTVCPLDFLKKPHSCIQIFSKNQHAMKHTHTIYKKDTYLILTLCWGIILNSRSTGKILGTLPSSFTSHNNHKLNWEVRSSSFPGSIFYSLGILPSGFPGLIRHSLGIPTSGFPGPQLSDKRHDTWVFLTRYQTEKRDRDPRIFLARSATH